jgi:predicted ATPase
MIRSFSIRNYRGFRDFRFEPLERVNLITGSNNVGKTSLLEALYLNLTPATAIGSNLNSDRQETSTRHNIFRGFKDIGLNLENVTKWGWLFHGKDLGKDIELVSVRRDGMARLTMGWWIEHESEAIPLTSDIPFDDLQTLFLQVRVENTDGIEQVWRIDRTSGHLSPKKYVFDSVPLRSLFNVSSRSPEEDTKWFSKLADVGRQDEIVDILRLIEPRLMSLAVSTSDGPAMIYGDIGVGRRVPMSQMGEGMVRLLSLVLEIANAAGGVLLIDEIENGLHHSVLTKVWRAIGEAARRSDTQVFATTHSLECIRAAHEAFLQNGAYDLGLHRLERINGDIKAVTYDKETLDTSVEMNLEVR